jgi:uncharacterized protein YaeQ
MVSERGAKCDTRPTGEKQIAMALTATLHHFAIELSDVDRQIYEALDLRVAQHPSETMEHVLARTLGYCLCYQDGIAFSKGLSTQDEPAAFVKDPGGTYQLWMDVGAPSAERLHKANKAARRVVVFAHQDPSVYLQRLAGATIHRAREIELYALSPQLIRELVPRIERRSQFALVHTEGSLYVTLDGQSFSGTITRHLLGE